MNTLRQRRNWIRLALVTLAVTCMVGERDARAAVKSAPRDVGPLNEVHSVESFVKRATQEMVDALAPGDTLVWSRYLAAECLYTDEEGETQTKSALLRQMRPLPSAYHGTIRLVHPRVVIVGETAALTTELLETLELYGQRLETRFHMTSTWVRKLDGWRMIASQTSVLPSEHQAIKLDPAGFDAYVGTYALAPDVTYAVTLEKGRLYGQRNGREKEELFPLGCDHFFRRGARRGEKIFVRDANGQVSQMIDRRDNNDLVWRRSELGALQGSK